MVSDARIKTNDRLPEPADHVIANDLQILLPFYFIPLRKVNAMLLCPLSANRSRTPFGPIQGLCFLQAAKKALFKQSLP